MKRLLLVKRADLAACQAISSLYTDTDFWLRLYDHHHLRVTRILAAQRKLLGAGSAVAFHAPVQARHAEASSPTNPDSLQCWEEALRR